MLLNFGFDSIRPWIIGKVMKGLFSLLLLTNESGHHSYFLDISEGKEGTSAFLSYTKEYYSASVMVYSLSRMFMIGSSLLL